MRTTARIALLVLLATATPAVAQEVDFGGSVAGELRWFPNDPLDPEQLESFQYSLALEPSLTAQSDSGRHSFALVPFARLDAQDSERTHFDIREAYWRGVFGDWEVLAGVNRVFWGVTESRHLVDVVNQTDILEDVDEEDWLGQPMVSVEWQRSWGRLAGLALIGFRPRSFPGPAGRLRFPLPVDTDEALFPDGERLVDLALRYSHFLGDFDVGVSLFHGTGREPAFRLDESDSTLIPVYSRITQASLDLQYTRNAWLWKLESLVRSGPGATFGAAVAGFEYTRYQVFGSAADLGLLAEYLYDGRDETAPPTPFENGLFLGARLALNDVQDTSLLAGAVVDLDNGTVAGRVEGERRLTANLKLELEARVFTSVDPESFLWFLRRDSFVTPRLGLFSSPQRRPPGRPLSSPDLSVGPAHRVDVQSVSRDLQITDRPTAARTRRAPLPRRAATPAGPASCARPPASPRPRGRRRQGR
jgi:hypothetical protein